MAERRRATQFGRGRIWARYQALETANWWIEKSTAMSRDRVGIMKQADA
jgi:hypothetical protein